MNRKYLIIINSLAIGGAERLVVDDINELVSRNFDVKLLTLKKEYANSFINELLLSRNNVITINFRSIWSIWAWIQTIRYIKQSKPDVLITHLWFSNTIGRVVGFVTGVKDIISFEHNVYDNVKTWKMFLIDRILQYVSKHIVAVSAAVKKSLLVHGIREDRIKVIVNCVDLEKFKTALPLVEINNVTDFKFLFVGRLINQKGVDILLKSFSVIQGATLYIVGAGKEEKKLLDMSEKLNISKRVKFLGIRKDVPEIYNSVDCFILPSRFEGLGIVVLEAMAAGLPIIVSDFDAVHDIVSDGVNGVIFKNEDSDGLSQLMKKIMNDALFRKKLAIASKETSNNFSVPSHVDKLLSLYI